MKYFLIILLFFAIGCDKDGLNYSETTEGGLDMDYAADVTLKKSGL